jgi:hypothetical protein
MSTQGVRIHQTVTLNRARRDMALASWKESARQLLTAVGGEEYEERRMHVVRLALAWARAEQDCPEDEP